MMQGADAPLSGLIAMLAAAEALRVAGQAESYRQHIVFSVFAGEAWDLMGSKRFLWEMHTGANSTVGLSADKLRMVRFEQCKVVKHHQFHASCLWRHMAVLLERTIAHCLLSFDQILEVGQVGRAPRAPGKAFQLFVHRHRRKAAGGVVPAGSALDAAIGAAAGGAGDPQVPLPLLQGRSVQVMHLLLSMPLCIRRRRCTMRALETLAFRLRRCSRCCAPRPTPMRRCWRSLTPLLQTLSTRASTTMEQTSTLARLRQRHPSSLARSMRWP